MDAISTSTAENKESVSGFALLWLYCLPEEPFPGVKQQREDQAASGVAKGDLRPPALLGCWSSCLQPPTLGQAAELAQG